MTMPHTGSLSGIRFATMTAATKSMDDGSGRYMCSRNASRSSPTAALDLTTYCSGETKEAPNPLGSEATGTAGIGGTPI
jgi:hypothetical protein